MGFVFQAVFRFSRSARFALSFLFLAFVSAASFAFLVVLSCFRPFFLREILPRTGQWSVRDGISLKKQRAAATQHQEEPKRTRKEEARPAAERNEKKGVTENGQIQEPKKVESHFVPDSEYTKVFSWHTSGPSRDFAKLTFLEFQKLKGGRRSKKFCA